MVELQTLSGYQTKQERITVAGVDDLIIRSLLDRRQFFDPLGAADRLGISSAAWPIFGLLWPSGAQLAARMARRPVSSDERVLEIGCGLALASLVGHRRGANVTASDCHPLAESFLAENLRLNELPPMQYRHGNWGDLGSPQPLVSSAQAPLTSPSDANGLYDLIIGSDVLYERDANGTLAGFIERQCSPAGSVWIVDPDRRNRPAFNRQMADQGFVMHEERLDTPSAPGAAAFKGRMLTYERADSLPV